MEIMATVDGPIKEGSWLLQAATAGDRPAAVVASALVTPREGEVPVRLLNPRAERVKIRGGAQIATLEQVQAPDEDDAVVIAAVEPDQVPKDQQQVLWGVAERLGPELSEDEREQFYNLLLMYSDVFASCDTDLGRTSCHKPVIPVVTFLTPLA